MKKRALRIFKVGFIAALIILLFAATLASAEGDKVLSDSAFSSVIMNVGEDQTQRNITFYAKTRDIGEIRYGKAENGKLPDDYSVAKTICAKASKPGYYLYKATLSGLEADTTYVYSMVVGDKISAARSFRVNSHGDDFSFAFIADAQTGSASDANLWTDTLKKLKDKFSSISFIVSAGDQTSDASLEEDFGYFISSELSTIAIATTVGPPHDNSRKYGEHYNLPNLSSTYGTSNTSSDYFYTYNTVLFMHLNVENTDYNSHVKFMQNAIADNPECIWRVVVLHYSFFTGGDHSEDGAVTNFRSALAGKFTELGIDVVLSGHDHLYSRSNMMKSGNSLSGDVVTNNSVTNPKGTLYLCNTRPSGGSDYTVEQHNDDKFIAYRTEVDRKAATIFEVTETSLTLNSYFFDGATPELFDTFTIIKTAPTVRVNPNTDKLELLIGASRRTPLVNAYAYTSAIVKVVGGTWSVSTNGGASYESLGISSQNVNYALRIGTNGIWEISYDGGASYESTGISSRSYTVRYVNLDGATFADGTDLSVFNERRFTATTPDAPDHQFSTGYIEDGEYIKWSWEYYDERGTRVTTFTFGKEYTAYPVATIYPVRNNIFIASTSVPENYVYTWDEAWEIISDFPGEAITLTLAEDLTVASQSKITLIASINVTIDLNGKTLNAPSTLLDFYVGATGSVIKFISTKENGRIKSSGAPVHLSSNSESVINVQYGSLDSYPITVSGKYLVNANSNFKRGATLNLSIFGGTYTLSSSIFYITNVNTSAPKNNYCLSLTNATFNFDGATVVSSSKSDIQASSDSTLTAEGCTFNNVSSTAKGFLSHDCWRGNMYFTACTFNGMLIGSVGTTAASNGSVTVRDDCTFINCSALFNSPKTAFKSSKITLAKGTKLSSASGSVTTSHEAGHTFVYRSADGYHYLVCSTCSDSYPRSTAACTGGTASCSTKAKCTVCKGSYGEMLPHSFSVSMNDAEYHWTQCSVCGTRDAANMAKHVSTGENAATCKKRATCDVCERVWGTVADHSFSEDLTFNRKYHWHACDCGLENELELHTLVKTKDENGKSVNACACGYSEPIEGIDSLVIIIAASCAVVAAAGVLAVLVIRKKRSKTKEN